MYKAETIGTAEVEFNEAGDFFRIVDSQADDITVRFFSHGQEIARAENVGEGYSEQFGVQFDSIKIKSTAGGNAVAFVIRYGSKVGYDKPPTGTVTLSGQSGAVVQSTATVTSASATLLAGNAGRRYLLIQNNHATGIIYVTLDGQTATAALGVKIAAGASLEIQGFSPTGIINAVGSVASNAAVVVAEG